MTQPGAQLPLFCFSDTDYQGIRMPNQVTQDDLRTHLGAHWDIRSIELADYSTSFNRELLERRGEDALGGVVGIDSDALSTDERGRVTVAVWQLHAVRR